MLGLAGSTRFGWVVRDASMLLENKKEGEVGEKEGPKAGWAVTGRKKVEKIVIQDGSPVAIYHRPWKEG